MKKLFIQKGVKTNKDHLAAFRRLRNYYQRNFEHGENDAVFHTWIEVMIDKDRIARGKKSLFENEND